MLQPVVLIMASDNFAAISLQQRISFIYPQAKYILTNRIEHARTAFIAAPIDILIASVMVADGDLLDMLLEQAEALRAPKRTLVVGGQLPLRVVNSLISLDVRGVFDAELGRPEDIDEALRVIEAGGRYWSSSYSQWRESEERRLLRQLSPTEQLVLAVIGAGETDLSAGEILGMRPSAVQAVRRDLHGKLRVHEKGALIKTAAQLGFTRMSVSGIEPLGLALLLKEYKTHAKRPVEIGVRSSSGSFPRGLAVA
jgi:DNA-binding NarL/FixJ family response regulator